MDGKAYTGGKMSSLLMGELAGHVVTMVWGDYHDPETKLFEIGRAHV